MGFAFRLSFIVVVRRCINSYAAIYKRASDKLLIIARMNLAGQFHVFLMAQSFHVNVLQPHRISNTNENNKERVLKMHLSYNSSLTL